MKVIARQLKHGRAALIRQLEKLAYEGDTQAVKFLVDKLYPARKLTMQPIV